ncbi:hypothetical protein MTF65_23220 [Streptomyces sp. APSN-46.1]|uniref:hypothetical protein n=1 Tax=Streptomyces sp. APSN-46.1 TaxID=2929049 RepID=UPI001FB30614|nr:hypothetical protein [Streptomyces sp. APSN-46.1]MCJ1680196.1 hypothetical protein [Streptomyces sp. APSN-46.1]
MRLAHRIIAIGAAAATAAIVSAGGAHADGDGLLGAVNGILNGPSLINICYPNVQNGYANHNGNQNSNCTQSATQTSSTSATPLEREIATSGPFNILPGAVEGHDVECPAGLEPVSGGANAGPAQFASIRINETHPSIFSDTAWHTTVTNEGNDDIDVTLYAVCETPA